MKRWVGVFGMIAVTVATASAQVDLFAHKPGLWSIAPDGPIRRWVEIHELAGARATGIFHVEVLGLRRGDPSWKVQHLAPHLAITQAALQRSVVKALTTGSVYPETFDSAYAQWRRARDAGGDAPVCPSTVLECLSADRNRATRQGW